MRIAIAQQNYHIGNFEQNTKKIIAAIEQAKQHNAELIVFSELSVCGYPPRDFLEFKDFIDECYKSVELIAKHTQGIGAIIGTPHKNPDIAGKDLFNAAHLIYDGKIIGTALKSLLPTYDIFDEYRFFEPANTWSVIEFKSERIALTICEDIWNLTDNPLYPASPMELLAKQSPTMLINVTASPFDYDHDDDRKEIILANINRYHLPIIYCNTIGAQTEIIFDGGSLVFNNTGGLHKELKYFEEDFYVFNTPDLNGKNKQASYKFTETRAAKVSDKEKVIEYLTSESNIAHIYEALILGIRDYFAKMNFKKAILGASGGIDSAVAQVLAVTALGKQNVHALLMPSAFSSSHSVTDAEQLCKLCGNSYDIISINEAYESFLSSLKPVFKNLPFGIAEENLQSRIRGNLLMAVANKFDYILLNTSNKSELAVGYGTLYGDMAGGLSVLGDLYKVQVYALSRFINKTKEIIPGHILSKPPSAELRPNQKDTDSLPDYSILDKVLFQYIEMRKGPKELIDQGFEPQLVSRILKLVNKAEFKRNQFCPVLRVSRKAFGVGRRMPIVSKYLA